MSLEVRGRAISPDIVNIVLSVGGRSAKNDGEANVFPDEVKGTDASECKRKGCK